MTGLKRFGIDNFTLKSIAILSMLIDHIGAVLFPEYIGFRIVGRLAFPIFCFLLVEGFFYTKNVYKYGLRLFIFVLLSEIPYDLAFYGKLFCFSYQNVFFTLLLGLILIFICERMSYLSVKIVMCLVFLCFANFIRSDYSFFGVGMIFLFYMFRKRPVFLVIGQGVVNILMGSVQVFGVLAMIPILLYNGKKGFSGLKYGFYLFYPVHLLILFFML